MSTLPNKKNIVLSLITFFAFTFLYFPASIFAVPVDTATPEEHESEKGLIQELSSAVKEVDSAILEQQNLLAKSVSDGERQLINSQIKTLEKHKKMLQGFLDEFTGGLTVKGVPLRDLLEEELRQQREDAAEERERQIVERRETELLERT
ncbi:MAG: hypothetical protein HY587_03960 [Candidatus Omnitrophica bacterium]|nr:hypothetical protein [Candidatus Omnitrophota bacterium]